MSIFILFLWNNAFKTFSWSRFDTKISLVDIPFSLVPCHMNVYFFAVISRYIVAWSTPNLLARKINKIEPDYWTYGIIVKPDCQDFTVIYLLYFILFFKKSLYSFIYVLRVICKKIWCACAFIAAVLFCITDRRCSNVLHLR